MGFLDAVVVDCRHPARLASFWAAALDQYQVAPYDDEELARLRDAGIDGPEDDPSVLVEPTDGGPRFFFNRVLEAKSVKNRVHLDIRAEDVDIEVRRLVTLGARELARVADWVTGADPEGNEFDVLPRD